MVNPMVHRGRINLMFLLSGIPWTILLTICCVLISNALGFLISLLGLAEQRLPRMLYRAYVEVFRSIPPLVSIFWVYYGLPILIDVGLEPFAAGMIALSLYGSAFMAEIFRGGVQSIDRGQFEAAHTLGLGYLDTMRFVIFPQALRRALPAIGNQLVITLKNDLTGIGHRCVRGVAARQRTCRYRVPTSGNLQHRRAAIPGAGIDRLGGRAQTRKAHGLGRAPGWTQHRRVKLNASSRPRQRMREVDAGFYSGSPLHHHLKAFYFAQTN